MRALVLCWLFAAPLLVIFGFAVTAFFGAVAGAVVVLVLMCLLVASVVYAVMKGP